MASDPITAWHIEGEKLEVLTEFLFLGSEITAGGDCSHEIRKHLLLGRKSKTNIDSVLKSRDIITLLTKVHRVKVMVFPVITYSCESWTVKKAEHLKAPWKARRSNQSILREINPEFSLEGWMLKLKL